MIHTKFVQRLSLVPLLLCGLIAASPVASLVERGAPQACHTYSGNLGQHSVFNQKKDLNMDHGRNFPVWRDTTDDNELWFYQAAAYPSTYALELSMQEGTYPKSVWNVRTNDGKTYSFTLNQNDQCTIRLDRIGGSAAAIDHIAVVQVDQY